MTRRGRSLWIAGVVAALVVAGVLSWYASSSPDGLEHAAEQAEFAQSASDSATAGSPLADYLVDGEENRFSAGVAGVIGVAVTLALAGGLALVLRRRDTPADRT